MWELILAWLIGAPQDREGRGVALRVTAIVLVLAAVALAIRVLID